MTTTGSMGGALPLLPHSTGPGPTGALACPTLRSLVQSPSRWPGAEYRAGLRGITSLLLDSLVQHQVHELVVSLEHPCHCRHKPQDMQKGDHSVPGISGECAKSGFLLTPAKNERGHHARAPSDAHHSARGTRWPFHFLCPIVDHHVLPGLGKRPRRDTPGGEQRSPQQMKHGTRAGNGGLEVNDSEAGCLLDPGMCSDLGVLR